MTATYIAMTLINDDGTKVQVWQKSIIATQTVVTGWVISYVDANDNPVTPSDPYEMTVIDGTTLNAPGP